MENVSDMSYKQDTRRKKNKIGLKLSSNIEGRKGTLKGSYYH